MDYYFAMKYVFIFAALIILVRIDLVLHTFDQLYDKYTKRGNETAPQTDVVIEREVISMKDDKTLAQGPRAIFFSLLEDFHQGPTKEKREKIIEIAKLNPTLFNDKLDKQLEATLYQLRDLLNQKNPEAIVLLVDFMNVLKVENLESVKRLFSLLIDIQIDYFIFYYSKTKDTNCMIISALADPLTDEEKLNLYYERTDALSAYLLKEKLDPIQKDFALRCQMVLKLQLDKLDPPTTNSPSTNSESIEAVPSETAPVATPAAVSP